MKKYLAYILIGLLVILVGVYLFTRSGITEHKLDSTLSFRKGDKIPYGTYAAYEMLPAVFPKAEIVVERKEPSRWKALNVKDSNQVLVCISPRLRMNKNDLEILVAFISKGNDAFFSSMEVPDLLLGGFEGEYNGGLTEGRFLFDFEPDSLTVSVAVPAGQAPRSFSYPGHSLDYSFRKMDTTKALPLGYARNGRPDFIVLHIGKGHLYVHTAPMTFTNYFILHKNNKEYYERVMSVLNSDAKRVAWDEYYLTHRGKRENEEEEPGWLSALMNLKNSEGKKPFGAAIWVLLGILLLYVLNEMRRRQRTIPVVRKPANDSLEFVKTIGRLYHDKADHMNLARKMAAYFLEHVRNRYKLATNNLDEGFCDTLHYKSGIDKQLITSIVQVIHSIDSHQSINAKELAAFHGLLEKFYSQ